MKKPSLMNRMKSIRKEYNMKPSLFNELASNFIKNFENCDKSYVRLIGGVEHYEFTFNFVDGGFNTIWSVPDFVTIIENINSMYNLKVEIKSIRCQNLAESKN